MIASADKKDLESLTVDRYEEKFQIFLAIAFVLLVAMMFIGNGKKVDNDTP